MLKYYVYAYLRKNGSPYYIGKGNGKRAWKKGKGEVQRPISDDRIIIVEKNLTLTGSLAIERRLIRWYGRMDKDEDGILRNRTDGGDGGQGAKLGTKLTSHTKNKISIANTGKKHGPRSEEDKKAISESMVGKNRGKRRTTAQKNEQSIRQTGKSRKSPTDKTKQKISESLKGRKNGPMNCSHKEKISKALTGVPKTSEAIEKQRQKLIGRTQTTQERENYLRSMEAGKTSCEHCGKMATKGNYIRWHGANCKSLLTGEDPFSKK